MYNFFDYCDVFRTADFAAHAMKSILIERQVLNVSHNSHPRPDLTLMDSCKAKTFTFDRVLI